jgi:lysophospholipase L1-like esterase
MSAALFGFAQAPLAEGLHGASQGKLSVVFMGDSITQGWSRDRPDFFALHGYTGKGKPGETAREMLGRFRTDVLDLNPSVVHIMAGTNDVAQNKGKETAQQIEGYISEMIDLSVDHHIQVVLAAIPPAARFPWHPKIAPVPLIREINQDLRILASQKHITFVDYGLILAEGNGAMKAEYTSDGVHPNAMAYAAIEPLTEAAIMRAMQGMP